MHRGFLAVVVAVLGPLALAGSARAAPAVTGYPNSIAVLGDSISVGYDADGTGPQAEPQYSWAAGTSSQVNSIYSRILAANPAISGNGFNEAVKGADMGDLQGQATTAVSQGAQEVLIMMGANDVCTDTQATMTPVATFRNELAASLKTISRGLPDARIQVLSIPNVYRLWQVLHPNASARFVWGFAGICQSMLANPNSTAPADVARRAAVLKREKQFNNALEKGCAAYIHCRFDGDAVFNYPFAASDADTLDYFHPSIVGQSILAQTVWGVGFDYADATPPVSQASTTPVSGGVQVTLTATDNVAVSGIEYAIGKGRWIRYTTPVTLLSGHALTWRAVDVNGNIEASQALVLDPPA
jgi:lysophospholipase L1-like esterase